MPADPTHDNSAEDKPLSLEDLGTIQAIHQAQEAARPAGAILTGYELIAELIELVETMEQAKCSPSRIA